ncbi:alpha/beta hydrolase [Curtobacterium sp. RRHDQ66]|uniref:alpha/beta hydrolase n=1 Tax=Curtobacterium guangdongense TaxID=3413380 RepID=UPI003BF39161
MSADPTAGDPQSIRSVAQRLQQRSSKIRTASSRVHRQAEVVSDGEWKAKNKASFVSAAAEIGSGGERIAGHVDRAATVLIAYAARIEQIQTEAQTIKAAQSRNHQDLTSNARAVDKLQQSDADDAPAKMLGLSAEAAGLQVSKVALEQSWQDLVARRKAADAETASKLGESEVIGAFATSAATITGMTDAQLLAFLSGLKPEEVAAFAGDKALADRLGKVSDPKAVAKWWSDLGGDDGKGSKGAHSAAQDAFIAAFPAVIGNLNGVAYWARDTANRAELRRQKHESDLRLADLHTRVNAAVERGLHPYDLANELQAERDLNKKLENFASAARGSQLPHDAAFRNQPVQIVSFRMGNPPLGAISVGDLDAAANVSYVVPGMATTMGDSTVLQRAARNIKEVQNAFTGDPSETAVVAWINYDTPVNALVDPFQVLSDDKANAGADRLAADLEGFRATRSDDTVLNVIGHSYGTTTASLALAHAADLHVQSFVNLGSAGIPTSIHDAGDLHAEHVYAGTGDESVAGLGRFGSGRTDPSSPSFGAEPLGTGSKTLGPSGAVAGSDVHGVTVHDPIKHKDTDDPYGYLDRKTSSLLDTATATLNPW